MDTTEQEGSKVLNKNTPLLNLQKGQGLADEQQYLTF